MAHARCLKYIRPHHTNEHRHTNGLERNQKSSDSFNLGEFIVRTIGSVIQVNGEKYQNLNCLFILNVLNHLTFIRIHSLREGKLRKFYSTSITSLSSGSWNIFRWKTNFLQTRDSRENSFFFHFLILHFQRIKKSKMRIFHSLQISIV